jgi:hypothetical protein
LPFSTARNTSVPRRTRQRGGAHRIAQTPILAVCNFCIIFNNLPTIDCCAFATGGQKISDPPRIRLLDRGSRGEFRLVIGFADCASLVFQ